MLTLGSAVAQAQSASFSWTLSNTPGVISQNVYRAACTGTVSAGVCSTDATASFSALAGGSLSATTTSYTDSTVVRGQKYIWYVTAVCPATGACIGESIPSSHIAAAIPGSAPNPPTNLTITSVAVNYSPNGQRETVTASWQDAPNTSTIYALFDFATLKAVKQGTVQQSNGMYSITWSGRRRPNLYLAVCDTMNCSIKKAA